MNLQRLLGAALVLAAYVPLHRLLGPERAGPAGASTRAVAEAAWQSGLLGTAIVLGAACAVSVLVPGDRVVDFARRGAAVLAGPSTAGFALFTAALATALALATAWWIHGGLPTSVDEMAQLLHARALLGGSLTLPAGDVPAAVVVQNGVLTADGWASIYPPLHTLFLALGLAGGASWVVGPLLLGTATLFATLAFERVLGATTGRAAGALLAVTPFWILLGSTHLSHTSAAAALAAVLWAALRSEDGHWRWTVALGAAVGSAVTARPWVGLVVAPTLIAFVWWTSDERPARAGAWLRRSAAVVAGGTPFAALLFWWNARLFGHPLRLGYETAFGPAHGLGLHADPWGNRYGLGEAVGYTGADLVQLGARLLEGPMPAVAVIGLGLIVARRRLPGGVFTAWAIAALIANALYWHHGVHFGPRMLLEATPAWVALFVVGATAAASAPIARGFFAWGVAFTLAGSLLLVPGAIGSAAAPAGAQPPPPDPADVTEAVIFAHGSWASRVASRLAAAGMRRDSIETALRRNDICAVDRFTRWREEPAGPAPALDFESLPGSPPTLGTRFLSEGNPVRLAPNGPRDESCAREAASDRHGVVELEPLLWRMPGGASSGIVLQRDLGPARNAEAASSDVPWFVYLADDGSAEPRLLDYDVGMELLWRGAAGAGIR